MIYKFIGSVFLFLGLLQFILGLNVGEFQAAKRHLILILAGTILIIFGICWKKKKQS